MANDYTKYNLDFLESGNAGFENLSKRQFVLETIKYLFNNHLSTLEVLNDANLNPTHNKQVVATPQEYDTFEEDKRARYSLIQTNDGNYYVSNQWRKSSIDGFIEYIEENFSDNISITEIFEEDEEDVVVVTNKESKYPLNQILYGAPGTGKTYNVTKIAEGIINENSIDGARIDDITSFDRICTYLRNNNKDSIYNSTSGNTIYRNFSKLIFVYGYFLAPQYDKTNTIIHSDLKDLEGFARSGWSQRIRYITEFGLAEGNWKENYSGQLGRDIQLSDLGIKLKELFRVYLIKENLTYQDLLNWQSTDGIPEFIKEFYFEILSNISPSDSITSFEKSIFCALNMALNGQLFKQNNEKRETTIEEKELVLKYIDVKDSSTNDFKWIGWLAKNIEDLGLVIAQKEEVDNKYFYDLTEKGKSLISKIIENWKLKRASLFGAHISYQDGLDLGLIKFVTFHQSYSYEEFIEGIRPVLSQDDDVKYELKSGLFKSISNNARFNPNSNFVLIIDEINRGNISKIFGELITLIEESKRIGNSDSLQVTLPYSQESFSVPQNLYIVGTMNSSDKSITAIDSALRRRFSFKEFSPVYQKELFNDILYKGTVLKTDEILMVINKRISILLDPEHQIGHSYFIGIDSWPKLCQLFIDKIIPLLREYFYNDFSKIQFILGDNDDWGKRPEEKFISKETMSLNNVFGSESLFEEGVENVKFQINKNLQEKLFNNLPVELFTKGFKPIN